MWIKVKRGIEGQVCYLMTQFILPFLIGMVIALVIVSWRRTPENLTEWNSAQDIGTVATDSVDLNFSFNSNSAFMIPSELDKVIESENPPIKGELEKDKENADEDSGGKGEQADPSKDMTFAEQEESPENFTRSVVGNETFIKNEMNFKRENTKKAQAERAAKGSWTCRHRWTKWLEQNSLYIPVELNEHFQRYNRLHDKLLRQLPIEVAFQTSLTSTQNSVGYIVWRPVGEDLAGRLLSLVSTYLLALLTDRVLLVNFPYVRHLFCEPFTRSSWIFPQKYLADLNKFMVMKEALKTRSPIRITRLRLNNNFQDDDSIFLTCNGNIKNMISHSQILLVESPIGFVELILANPSHKNRLGELFQGTSIYTQLFHNLIHPANDMWFRIIDAYHVHFTNDYDRPQRLAVYMETVNEQDPIYSAVNLRHKMQCAAAKLTTASDVPFSRGRIIYYSPSNPSNNPKIWARRIFQLPNNHKIVTATDENSKKGYLGDMRRLMTDLWMISWTSIYVFREGTQAAIAAHYYRAKDSWVIGGEDDGGQEEGGKCLFKLVKPTFLSSLPDNLVNCVAFRQSWRAKDRKKVQQPKESYENQQYS